MSRRANCWDNAPMESFFASLKKELTHGENFATREEAQGEPLRVHRGLLQPGPAAFVAGIPVTGRVRDEPDKPLTRCPPSVGKSIPRQS